MHDYKDSWFGAEAQENEPIFSGRMARVVQQQGVVIVEDGLGFVKRDPMLAEIRRRLG